MTLNYLVKIFLVSNSFIISIGVTVNMFICFSGGILFWRYVRMIEKVEKQNEIAKIHRESELEIFITDITFFAALLLQEYRTINKNTNDHLKNL